MSKACLNEVTSLRQTDGQSDRQTETLQEMSYLFSTSFLDL